MPYLKQLFTYLAAGAALLVMSPAHASDAHLSDTNPSQTEATLQHTRSFITLNNDSILWAGFSGYEDNKRWLVGRLEENNDKEFISIIDLPSRTLGAYTTAKYLLADEANQYLYVIGVGNRNEHVLTRLHLSDLSVDVLFGSMGFVSLYPELLTVDGFSMDQNGGLLVSGRNDQAHNLVLRFSEHGYPDFDYQWTGNGVALE